MEAASWERQEEGAAAWYRKQQQQYNKNGAGDGSRQGKQQWQQLNITGAAARKKCEDEVDDNDVNREEDGESCLWGVAETK